MLEAWILSKLEPLKDSQMILLRDPQRIIRSGAQAVDGWAEANGFTVLFCTGNLALREMYESLRDVIDARVLLVDRSRPLTPIRENAVTAGGLFYPDLEAAAYMPGARTPSTSSPTLELSLRDFFVEQTGDLTWPHLVDDRNLSRLILSNLEETLEAYRHLRQLSATRFSDSDLYKIVLGAALGVNPFIKLSPAQVRKVCIEQHATIEELDKILPEEVRRILRDMIEKAPKPFCYLLQRDPEPILRAFTLSAVLRAHGLDAMLLLTNLDPSLHEYRDIDVKVLDEALNDQLALDPDRVLGDIQKVEDFLKEDPARLAFLLRDQLKLDTPQGAVDALKRERLSGMVRSLALASLLVELVGSREWQKHQKVLANLEKQEQDSSFVVSRRPSEHWLGLMAAYRRAITVFELTGRLVQIAKEFKVAQPGDLTIEHFHKLWNTDRLNRLDFYLSDLTRMLRLTELPVLPDALWPEFKERWEEARATFKDTASAVEKVFLVINKQFQDLYTQNYAAWIRWPDSPIIFTHQFLPRLLKAHWDPKSGRKAVILVFDGLRTDAWDEFVRPVLEERFEVIQSQPGSAIIPTETELSRKAISAGCLPGDFPIRSKRELDLLKEWLKTSMGLNPFFEAEENEDTAASGITVRYRSPQIEYIVFNFTDDNLHHNSQEFAFIYNVTVREIIRQDVRSVLREIPANSMVFITADHGFTIMPFDTLDIDGSVTPDQNLIKYRSVRASRLPSKPLVDQMVAFDIRDLRIPVHSVPPSEDPIRYVLFARPPYVFRRDAYKHNPDKYSHGGLSLSECFVPMVVMGPRKAETGPLSLESVRQVGSLSEGESLEVEITVKAREMLFDGLPLTLTFSRNEIAERKEFFSGVEKTYRLNWKPVMPEISEDDRARGYVEFPLSVSLNYRYKEQPHRASRMVDVRVKLDTSRLRRRIDSKLDLMMGKKPGSVSGIS